MRRDKPNEWISIADLMAGVVGVVVLFFLIMALLAHKAAAGSAGEGEAAKIARAQIVGDLQSIQEKTANADLIKIFKAKDVVAVPSDEMFNIGKAALTAPGRGTTDRLLTRLAEILPCYSKSGVRCSDTQPRRWPCHRNERCVGATPIFEAVLIEGHADASNNSNDCDNWCLSTARAKAVFDVARAQYGSLLHLENAEGQPLIGLAGYGESRPIAHFDATAPIQRRIELRFILSPSFAPRSDK
jgi:hypothetical protein